MAGKAKFCWKLPEEWKNCARLWYSYNGTRWKRKKVSPLPATGELTITVTWTNQTEEEWVIPAGDRFCWVTVRDKEPEPLNLEQVEEVGGTDDQVSEEVTEPVHEDHGADTVGGTEARGHAEAGSNAPEGLADLGKEDA